jgi:hypothetical protein
VLCVVNFNSGIQKKACAPLKKNYFKTTSSAKATARVPESFWESPTKVPKKFEGAEEERKGTLVQQKKFFKWYFL